MKTMFLEGSAQKVLHAKEVYNAIRKYGMISKADIKDKLGMPLTSLNRTLELLLSIGLVEEGSIGKSSGGRKPVLYNIKADAYYLIGVDISRTSVRIVITDLNLKIIYKSNFDIGKDAEPKAVIQKVAQTIGYATTELKIANTRVLGVGVGTVGPLNQERGTLLAVEGFDSKQWVNFPLKKVMEEETGLFTLVANGANAAVLAEYWRDSGKNYQDIVYMIIGVGVRCGVISNGQLLSVTDSKEDRYGHIILSLGGKRCYCGNRGCLERYVSIPALLEAYRERLDESGKSHGEMLHRELYWESFCKHAKAGDAEAEKAISEASSYLCAGLITIVNILQPQRVVLGGAAINTCEPLYEKTVKAVMKSLKKMNLDVVLSRGAYGEDAIAVGAATLIFDYYLGSKATAFSFKT